MIKPLKLAHKLLEEVIEPSDLVVDATMGNGYDTLFLAELGAEVIAFDVQEAALRATEERLKKAEQTAKLVLDGHENIDQYISGAIKAAVFNLGYLPKADKSLITKPETTLKALEILTEKLLKGGRILLMIYYGHEGGEAEKNAVMDWASKLSQAEWEVFVYAPLNQIHTPPILLCLEKIN